MKLDPSRGIYAVFRAAHHACDVIVYAEQVTLRERSYYEWH
jgi:hypothetical protein